MNVREELFKNQDLKYRDFSKKIINNIDGEKIIGVRMPALRKIAKQAYIENAENLCEYYEEKMVKGFAISYKKCGAKEHMDDLKGFVPLIDNWALCDSPCAAFKFTEKYKDEMFDFICSYLDKSEYETRFAVVMLMDYYLDDKYIDAVLKILMNLKSEYYYVNMASAWALSVAFVKYREKTLEAFESGRLSDTVMNMAVQKIRDSYRVSKEDKEIVKKYKTKQN